MSDRRTLSRAEQVRRRRAERAARELQEAASRALKPMVKVTSRAPAIPMTLAPRKKARRYNIALNLPDLRLHKPNITLPNFSLPRLRPNWRLASFILAILLGVVIYFILTLPYFYVPAAIVLGNNRLSREDINGVLGVSGESIFTVQPEEVRARLLLNYPELLSAQVDVYLPNRVHVTVIERQPVIFWEQAGKGYTWIDANGVAFRPRGFAEGLVTVRALDAPPAGFPSDDSLRPTPYITTELVEAVRLLAPLAPAGSPLTYSTADGLAWDDPRGWRAVFGASANDMPLKIRVYQALVQSLTARGIYPVLINVKYPDGPFYRMASAGDAAEETAGSGQ